MAEVKCGTQESWKSAPKHTAQVIDPDFLSFRLSPVPYSRHSWFQHFSESTFAAHSRPFPHLAIEQEWPQSVFVL
jgi:hypothetical protein